jgi:CRP-like cAMP-binding protein
MELPAIADMLGKTELFGPLSEADRAMIAGRMRRVEFTPDQMIFSRGDPGREIYLVLEGRIRLSILSSDGRELSSRTRGREAFSARSPRLTAASGPPAPPRYQASRP